MDDVRARRRDPGSAGRVPGRPLDAPPTVLLIDDREEQGDLVRRRLRPHGVRVEWRTCYRSALDLLQDPVLGPRVDLVLIDQAFDTEAVAAADLLTAADVASGDAVARWDVRLHQGFFILARLSDDMREGRVRRTRLILLTSHANPPVAFSGLEHGHLTKRSLITDAYHALKDHLERMRPAADDVAARGPQLRERVLVVLGPGLPVPWDGPNLDAADAGLLCADGPTSLTIWAPARRWMLAFALLAMCKSARPEESRVLTDEEVPLDLVPYDGRVQVVGRNAPGDVLCGAAAYACRNLRDDEVFRSLLTGRPRPRPGLLPLVSLHALARTPHGGEVLRRWETILPTLFTGDPPDLPTQLRADMEELAEAADRADRACAGGFHGLDRVVRGAREWEAAAGTYLRLTALGPAAAAAAECWLTATAGWHTASDQRGEALRTSAARALHRLVDDPWLDDGPAGRLFADAGSETP